MSEFVRKEIKYVLERTPMLRLRGYPLGRSENAVLLTYAGRLLREYAYSRLAERKVNH